VIFCDDCTFAAKARAALERVAGSPEINLSWAVSVWPLNVLHHTSTSERALLESADAHLIVIPREYAENLPPRLNSWLELWAKTRNIEDAGIGVIASSQRLDLGICNTLMELISRHRLHLISSPTLSNPSHVAPTCGASSRDAQRLVPSNLSQTGISDGAQRGFGR
jgi:hypothetical protein